MRGQPDARTEGSSHNRVTIDQSWDNCCLLLGDECDVNQINETVREEIDQSGLPWIDQLSKHHEEVSLDCCIKSNSECVPWDASYSGLPPSNDQLNKHHGEASVGRGIGNLFDHNAGSSFDVKPGASVINNGEGDVVICQGGLEKEGGFDLAINLTTLAPSKLIVIPIVIAGNTYDALVDSGSTANIIKRDVFDKSHGLMDSSVQFTIKGLGDASVGTLGSTSLYTSILGLSESNDIFQVVENACLNFEVVLGLEFLKHNHLSIDARHRSITKFLDSDKSSVYYINNQGKVEYVVHERFPVVAAMSVSVAGTASQLVPVAIELPACQSSRALSDFYYENKPKNVHVGTCDGIISVVDSEPMMVSVCSRKSPRDVLVQIKKGERLGYASTLVELEPDNMDLDNWSVDKVQEVIKLENNLSDAEKNKVYNMLVNTQLAISKSEFDIGKAAVIPHKIQLSNNTPVWQRPRRFSEPINREIDRQCRELLSLDVIENSNSPWSSPVVPVLKKPAVPGGRQEVRMCVDYRRLNQQTITERFPMPDLSENIYSSFGNRYFTKLDLIKGYYQVPLDADSRELTAFSTPHGHYHFKTLSFGLKNSAIAFQKKHATSSVGCMFQQCVGIHR